MGLKRIGVCILLVFFCLGSAWTQETLKSIDEHQPGKRVQNTIARAEELRQADKIQEAIKILEESVQKEPDPVALFTLGNFYFLNEQSARAITPYQKALSEVPIYPVCRRNLGRVYFSLQRYHKAVREFRTIITQNKADSPTLLLLGQSYYMMENISGALESLRRALFYEPERVEPRIWLIRCFWHEARYREAERLCEESLKLHPTNATLLEFLGNIYIANQQYGKAVDILKTLQLFGQAKPRLLLTLGDLYMKQAMYLEAAETYETAFKEKEPNENDLLRLAQAKWYGEALEGALQICNQLLEIAPQSYQAYLLKGRILVESGNDQAALESFQKVNSLKAGVGKAWLGMGQIYLKREEFLEAKKYYQAAAKIKDTAAAGWAGLGEVAYARDRIDESIKCYQQALSIEPGNKDYYNMLIDLQKIQQYIESED